MLILAFNPGVWMCLAFGILVLLALGTTFFYGRRRQKKMQEVAQRVGWDYSHDAQNMIGLALPDFELFRNGRSRYRFNAMVGRIEDIDIAIFDYRYSTGSGKNQSTSTQTVYAFRLPGAAIPAFSLRAERLFHKLGKLFGFDDINFDESPGFSSKFLLRGSDEPAIRAFFHADLLHDLDMKLDRRWTVEGDGQWLIFYRPGRSARVSDIETQLHEVMGKLLLFSKGR